MTNINITKNTKDKLDPLVRFIYDSVEINYVIAMEDDQVVKYYDRSNKWRDNKNSNERCNGYFDCDFHDRITTDDPIGYEFKYEPNFETIMNDNNKLTMKDMQILENNRLEDINLEFSEPLILHNPHGVNPDHRGSDHTKLILDFHDSIVLEPDNGKINFFDFVDGCFRIKSHKFDFWYELFGGIKLHRPQNGKLTAVFSFDHGS